MPLLQNQTIANANAHQNGIIQSHVSHSEVLGLELEDARHLKSPLDHKDVDAINRHLEE